MAECPGRQAGVRLPADRGAGGLRPGFKVEKVGPEADGAAYHVNIDGDRRTCECKGYLRHGHCKHGDGLAALLAAGRL
jgi:hypothetical protein